MAKPTDVDAAVRHLLRHLSDVTALRKNRLVSHLFPPTRDFAADRSIARRIRHEVEVCAGQMLAEAKDDPRQADALTRQHAIIMRCDVRGELHKLVLRELGLERRQFYRERKRARARIARRFAGDLVGMTQPVECFDRFVLGFAHLSSLRTSGDHSRAISVATTMLCDTRDTSRRIDLVGMLAELQAECGDYQRAADCVELLRAENDGGDIRIAWAAAFVAAMSGQFEAAASSLRRIIGGLERQGPQRTNAYDELLARSYLQLALCRHIFGDFSVAISSWNSARDLMARSPGLSAEIRAQILCQLGAASVMTPNGLDPAAEFFQQAIVLAKRFSMPREMVDISLGLANLHLKRQKFSLARDAARDALTLSENVFGANAHAWRCLSVASVEFATGNAIDAAALARCALMLGRSNPMRDGLAKSIESAALFSHGDAEAALPISIEAVHALRETNNLRHLGSTLRINADIAYRLRRKKEARQAIDEAVELLSTFGLPRARENALRTRERIAGDHSHLPQAR